MCLRFATWFGTIVHSYIWGFLLVLSLTVVEGQPLGSDRDINVADVVMRGPDWQWADQDGGKDSQGIVTEILAWKGETDPHKFGVRVAWMTGDVNVYRWGAMGKYDLVVVGKVSKETASEMRDRYYEQLRDQLVYQDLPISDFERSVLIQIYAMSNRKGMWKQAHGWSNPYASDPCVDRDWDGVVCENGYVIALDLAENGLAAKFTNLPIKQLPGLRSLNLAHNQLSGAFPRDIAYLEDLQFLALDGNQLTSYIPADIGRLRKLQWLSVEANQLIGRIPKGLGSGLQFLQHLRLGNNRITGTIPDSLATIGPLRTLYLQRTQLTGTVPDAFLPKLQLRVPRATQSVSAGDASGDEHVDPVPLRLRIRPDTRLSASPAMAAAMLAANTAAEQAERQRRNDNLGLQKPNEVKEMRDDRFQWNTQKLGARPEVLHWGNRDSMQGNTQPQHRQPARRFLDPSDPQNYHWGLQRPTL